VFVSEPAPLHSVCRITEPNEVCSGDLLLYLSIYGALPCFFSTLRFCCYFYFYSLRLLAFSPPLFIPFLLPALKRIGPPQTSQISWTMDKESTDSSLQRVQSLQPGSIESGADHEVEKGLVRKLDEHIIPRIMLVYLLSFLDRFSSFLNSLLRLRTWD